MHPQAVIGIVHSKQPCQPLPQIFLRDSAVHLSDNALAERAIHILDHPAVRQFSPQQLAPDGTITARSLLRLPVILIRSNGEMTAVSVFSPVEWQPQIRQTADKAAQFRSEFDNPGPRTHLLLQRRDNGHTVTQQCFPFSLLSEGDAPPCQQSGGQPVNEDR